MQRFSFLQLTSCSVPMPAARLKPLVKAVALACLAASPAPGLRAASLPFAGQSLVSNGADGAYHVVSADIDKDGDADLVSASRLDNKIAWYENSNGDASAWTVHTVSTAADRPVRVAAADVDGDGDIDLLAASSGNDTIFWYENTAGDGSAWTTHTVSSNADSATSVVAADMDRDGDLDVVSSSGADDKIAWYENTSGDGSTWTPQTVSTTADSAFAVAAADLDGDGDPDLIASASYIDTVVWYENTNGAATAWSPQTLSTSMDGAVSVAAADLDGDGDADVLAAAVFGDSVVWYENTNGDAAVWATHTVSTSADGVFSADAADLDGDGDLDLIAALSDDDAVIWYENTSGDAGTWSTHTVTLATNSARAAIAADLDGDGDLDVASASFFDDKIAWYENQTIHRSASFPNQEVIANSTSTVFDPGFGALADVDGDGDVDLFFWLGNSNSSKIHWYENAGPPSGTWSSQTVATSVGVPRAIASADVDGDGDVDLFGASKYDARWYESTAGDGSAWSTHTIASGGDQLGNSIVASDVDDDGDTDLVAIRLPSSSNPKIVWNENDDGDGSSWSTHTISVTQGLLQSVAVADIDGDGDGDIVSATAYPNQLQWHENLSGDGSTWVKRVAWSSGPNYGNVIPVDLDRDGDIDLLATADNGTDQLVVWYEHFSSSGLWIDHVISQETSTAPSSFDPPFPSVADLDGDGDLDVLMATRFNDHMSWIENTAGDASNWTTHPVNISVEAPTWAASADIDGDGKLDVLASSLVDDIIFWHPNLGGQFALDTYNTAPGAVSQGTAEDVLEIEMHHLGRSGDTDAELATLELLIEETVGDPLSSTEANALIDNLHVYRDDGSGVFEAGSDTLVQTLTNFSLVDGVQTISFSDGDANVQVPFGAPERFFVVPELTANAAFQAPNRFRITHLTESSSSAEDRDYDIPLSLEYAANVSTGTVSAGCAGDTLAIAGISIAGQTLTCTATTSITTSGSVAFTAASNITFSAPQVALGPGFSVEIGSLFKVDN